MHSSMLRWYLAPALLAAAFLGFGVCCRPVDANKPTDRAQSTSGRVIHADLYVYNPGTRPAGIGDRLVGARELADEWQRSHPHHEVRYQVLGMLSGSRQEGEDLKTQLVGGIAPEIIHLNAETAWPDVAKGWYVPLDEYLAQPNPYVPGNQAWIDLFKNQALLNAKRAPDGKLYCLPIDMVETGLFFNRDILRAHGFADMPDTWAEMLLMFEKLDNAGVTPMGVPGRFGADWGQDIIFEMIYHDILDELDLVPAASRARAYLGHYLEPAEAGFLYTRGFFTPRDPRWVEMHRLLEQWRQYWPKELKNSDLVRLFLMKRVAMVWLSSDFTRRMVHDPMIDFDWDVAYIPRLTERTSRFASGTPATVIGGAATQLHVTNSAVKNGNLTACVDFLMFLTAPRNTEQLVNEAGVYSPNIIDVQPSAELTPFADILARPYCAIKWMESLDGEPKQAWRRWQDYWLQGGYGRAAFLTQLDDIFAAWVEGHRAAGHWNFDRYERAWLAKAEGLRHALDAGD